MFVKVFSQIFDSSIAENYELRHFFEDMLKLADVDGVVDMTPEAISRRINLPLDKVTLFLGELAKPDERSRSQEHEGRRIVPLDSHRNWGWIVVNYTHYRKLRDEESRREYFRDAKRKQREREPKKTNGLTIRQQVRRSVENDPITKRDKQSLRRLNKTPTKAQREYDIEEENEAHPDDSGNGQAERGQ